MFGTMHGAHGRMGTIKLAEINRPLSVPLKVPLVSCLVARACAHSAYVRRPSGLCSELRMPWRGMHAYAYEVAGCGTDKQDTDLAAVFRTSKKPAGPAVRTYVKQGGQAAEAALSRQRRQWVLSCPRARSRRPRRCPA
jgi:hypothetical protein